MHWLPYSCHTSHHPSQTPCLPWISYATQKTDARFLQNAPKAVWSIPYVSVAFFQQNFIACRSSKVSSRPDCIFETHQLWQSGFSRVYSNCCCSYLFESEIIKIGQSSHKMYSNNIVNFQESTTILNACTKKVWKLIECTMYQLPEHAIFFWVSCLSKKNHHHINGLHLFLDSFGWRCLQISCDVKYFFLSCLRHCDQGLISVIVYYYQIWNKKEHNIIISRVISCHMGHVYIETPYICWLDWETHKKHGSTFSVRTFPVSFSLLSVYATVETGRSGQRISRDEKCHFLTPQLCSSHYQNNKKCHFLW